MPFSAIILVLHPVIDRQLAQGIRYLLAHGIEPPATLNYISGKKNEWMDGWIPLLPFLWHQSICSFCECLLCEHVENVVKDSL